MRNQTLNKGEAMNFFSKNKPFIYIVILFIICFFLYCINNAGYPFMDDIETKFVSIAKDMLEYKDWMNIRLNGENVFGLTPLYFWITNISCMIFGKISADVVRLPISIISLIMILSLFTVLQKILTKVYALIISLIMATCLGILIFSRLSTNDIFYVFFTMMTILFGYLAIFSKKDKYVFLYWLGIYIFSALSLLCSGLYGPFTSLFAIILMHIFSGDLKEIFKPKNMIPGLIAFIIIAIPWHSYMFYTHGILFIKEYFNSYNFINSINIKNILFVIGIFMLGFSPWVFSFLWILGRKFKDIIKSVFNYFKDNSQDKLKEKWKKLSLNDKFVSLNTIVFFTSLIFALLYGINRPFLILFMIFPSSCISGYFWWEYIVKKRHDKSIFFATIIPNLILIICSMIGLFGHNILNKWLFQGLNHLLIPLVIIFFVIPVISIFTVILKGRTASYIANLILMISLSFVITPSIFNFISLNSGENDLITFAKKAIEDKAELTAFIPEKYSLIYYYDNPIKFNNIKDLESLKNYLKDNPKAYVVVEIKDMWDIEDYKIKYMLLDAGKRYSLIQHMTQEQEKLEDTTEPEVIVY